MRIESLLVHKVNLPFKNDFSHAGRSGLFTGNVVVEIVASSGKIRAYGECAPRSYVTGETQHSVVRSIELFLKNGCFPWDVEHVSQVWSFIDSLPDAKEHNAALCALEMALLDTIGKTKHCSVMDFFPSEFLAHTVFYGAALPLDNKKRIVEMCGIAKRLKISRLKLKMGEDLTFNTEILEGVREVFGSQCELKVDANCAWDLENALRHLPVLEEYNVRVVEQPLAPLDPRIADLAKAVKQRHMRLMADESACSQAEVEKLATEEHYDMFNIRLSKCGGFRRSLRIIEFLRARNIPFQVACQLGESGLLSAAGRALSLLCRDALYHDGSYDDYLLKENITKKNISFGWAGEAGPLGGVGLGVEVDVEKLTRLSGPIGPVSILRA
jgi:L-alanine-DL-glutamate epimerase-like enolase superfamily enzyme